MSSRLTETRAVIRSQLEGFCLGELIQVHAQTVGFFVGE